MLNDLIATDDGQVEETIALPPLPPPPPNLSDDLWASSEEMESALLSKEQRELRRLAKRPSIDHLVDGVGVLSTGDKVALFDVGDRIVVERNLTWSLSTWLDTRVYTVKAIDDETGVVRCIDEEMQHHAFVGFKHPGQTFKLAPKKGNPFTQGAVREALKAAKAAQLVEEKGSAGPTQGEKKGRGRPKGSKNRAREEIKAEKEARKAERAEKRARRKRK